MHLGGGGREEEEKSGLFSREEMEESGAIPQNPAQHPPPLPGKGCPPTHPGIFHLCKNGKRRPLLARYLPP